MATTAEKAVTEQVTEQAPQPIKCRNSSKIAIATSKGILKPGEDAQLPFGEWSGLLTSGLEPI